MTRPRVLVFEEDPVVARSITSVLEAAGFDALPACESGAAWDDARAQLPDFALLDISPPHRDDMALAQRLAQARVPFVVLSARDDTALVERAIEAGAMGCFFKPLEVAIIVPSIRAWIARATELVHLLHEQQSLLEALRHHRSIGAAVGVIMERHGLTPGGAFEVLRRQARNQRQSVAKLASAVVAGTASLQSPPPAD
ncbi:ANTAR domain-containing response regulator [Piscinibacter sp.]|jgi:AmiR/NasT family two-component response regulator|uniref:ANTAR domain-containing response regulator n=1 Tax=Piscinibacter sp. TaxID=1903157 RepID=UPI00355A1922